MPTKKIVPKPEIDIVEINQSDLDKSENEDDNELDSEDAQKIEDKPKGRPAEPGGSAKLRDRERPAKLDRRSSCGARIPPGVLLPKQNKKEVIIKPDELNVKTKQPISQGRLNALAAGRKRAHEKRVEKKKAEVEALRLQLKKELEAELKVPVEQPVAQTINQQSKEHLQVPSSPLNTPNESTQGSKLDGVPTKQGVCRLSRLRIIEDSTMNQHNGHSTYGGFQIPHVGGIIKKLGRKLN